MAILCTEQILNVIHAPQVQIFATDIDEGAIKKALEGLYTINDAADVSLERLLNFLIRRAMFIWIKREVREMVLFANHTFLKDPPFSNLDMRRSGFLKLFILRLNLLEFFSRVV